ncbi:unnamed protein product [Kuraishia capsulata CBS 1993]|uniref:RBR-type E3 ubiquitin transferase n=1 Tax=Kuraishia capsulata CBS 1993 TaxID=1382522 RepID=W6MME9_9ASCO|nr:uncharacterized protein KUCA_T00003700001 [Kuraishia capsulata CBS 1993]CDK27721.1 unnamed protein product [Kuraishia capsulata CBS 1993]
MSGSEFSFSEEGYSSFDEDDGYQLSIGDTDVAFDPDASQVEVKYSYPDATTSTKVPINRIKYQALSYDDVDALLTEKIKSVNGILQVGDDESMVLLQKFNWKVERLLEKFLDNPIRTYDSVGLNYNAVRVQPEKLIVVDPHFFCPICCSEGSEENPLTTFHSGGCDHRYCVNCYATFLKEKTTLTCMDTECHSVILPSELKSLSDCILNAESVLGDASNGLAASKTEASADFYGYASDSATTRGNDYSDDEDAAELDSDGEEIEEQRYLVEYRKRKLEKAVQDKEKQRNKSLYSRYRSKIMKDHVSQQADFRLCPALDCPGIVRFIDFDSNSASSGITGLEQFANQHRSFPIVECSYNHFFCFYCSKDNHVPIPCPIVKAWIKKCKDDSETANWIDNNTKPCPQCDTNIEKNGGCNHMTCKTCCHEFCWICMGLWKDHKDFYKCNRYQEVKDDSPQKENSRRYLEKYLFYYNRFAAHQTSFKKDREFCSKLDFLIQKVQKRNKVSWIETQFYEEAVRILLKGRHTLMWSYAFLYYVEPCRLKHLIEDSQFELSKAVESLSKLIETVKPENIIKYRQRFIKESGLLKSHKYALVDICLDALASDELLISIPT